MDIEVRWRAFPLNPGVPEHGQTLEDLFKKKGVQVDAGKMMESLKKTAAGLGLEMGDRKMAYNSRLAQEVGLWAQAKGCGHQFHIQAFKAYFVDGKNIAQKDVLLNLIAQSGLDVKEGKTVIDNRTFSDAVDSDWQLSKKFRISAVPTFINGSERLVGAQPYEALKKLLLS